MDELVLDTTYLLPIFGVSIKLPRFKEVFPQLLSRYRVLYNPGSIIEAKWIVLGLSKGRRERSLTLARYRKGLKTLLFEERLVQTVLTSPEVEEVADKLLIDAGLQDYFDRVIYATAVVRNAMLLTEDQELHQVAKTPELPRPRRVLKWLDLATT